MTCCILFCMFSPHHYGYVLGRRQLTVSFVWIPPTAYMCCFDKAFSPHWIFENHVLIVLSHTEKGMTGCCAFAGSDQQQGARVVCFLQKLSFDLSLLYLHITFKAFQGITLNHFTLSLNNGQDEHVGCERTNPVDLILWNSLFQAFQPDQKIFSPPLFCSSTLPLSLFLSVSFAHPSVFQRSHLQRAAAERCPFKD